VQPRAMLMLMLELLGAFSAGQLELLSKTV